MILILSHPSLGKEHDCAKEIPSPLIVLHIATQCTLTVDHCILIWTLTSQSMSHVEEIVPQIVNYILNLYDFLMQKSKRKKRVF